jgi:ABC-2 type transport system ATP-binding protein
VVGFHAASKRYGATLALDGLDLEVRRGELLALLGPNGAGKTTAISLSLGLVEPDAGEITLMGGSPLAIENRLEVGMMLQEVNLAPALRPRELIELVASYYPRPMPMDEVLTLTGIEAFADKPYGKLSGGQKRRVQFAAAVCGNPRLLFLDEPTVGLDVEARESMWRTIRQLIDSGCSIVLTTHYLEEAEALADRVAVLVRGKLVALGSVEEMRALVSRKLIRCVTSLSADEIRAWPGVIEVVVEGAAEVVAEGGVEGGVEGLEEEHSLAITASEAEDVVRRLLAADGDLRKLDVRQASLAEAFAEITREAA